MVVVVGENIPSGVPPTQNVYFGCKGCNFSLRKKPILPQLMGILYQRANEAMFDIP